ncbi:MAG: hypothetical protein WBX15_07305 [Thermoanaerobaculia bacterium]
MIPRSFRLLLSAGAVAAVLSLSGAGASTASAAVSDPLALVPADAATVGMVRIGELKKSPLFSRLFSETNHMTVDGDAALFLSDAGIDIDRDVKLIVFAARPGNLVSEDASDGLVIVQGKFDSTRFGSAMANRGALVQKNENGVYYLVRNEHGADAEIGDHPGAVALLSGRFAVIGSESAVTAAMQAFTSGGTSFSTRGILGAELPRIDRAASAWVLIDLARASRMGGPSHAMRSRGDGNLQSSLKNVSSFALWTATDSDDLRFGASARTRDSETSQLLEDTVRGMLSAWRLAAQEKSPELVAAIRGFEVQSRGDSVSLQGTIPGNVVRNLVKDHPSHESR